MDIQEDVPLSKCCTLKIGGPARYFLAIGHEYEVSKALRWGSDQNVPFLVVGEGSNIVVSDRGFDGLVLRMNISGIEIVNETHDFVEIAAGAGVVWDDFVAYTVQHGWWGVENMSLIPGTVGALPVQNVGAYGQDSRQVITRVRAYDSREHKIVEIDNRNCNFQYRKSIFNTTAARRYVIVSVVFKLCKTPRPCLTRSDLVKELRKNPAARRCHARPSNADVHLQAEIRDAVIRLRRSGKALPVSPTDASVGSFFQIPVLTRNEFWRALDEMRRNISCGIALNFLTRGIMQRSSAGIRLSSRLFIQSCGAAGVTSGSISLYQNKPTVLVNSGENSSSAEVLYVAREVRKRIFEKTGVILPIEPSFVGFTAPELLALDLQEAPSCPA